MGLKRKKRAKDMQEKKSVPRSRTGRRRFILLLFLIGMTGLVWRAVDQQIFEKDFLQSEGAERYLDRVEVPAHRGVITDRKGAVLAMSTPVDSVAANPRLLRADAENLAPLAKALGMKLDDLRQRLARYSHKHFVYLKRRLPPEQADKILNVGKKSGLKGLHLEREYRRYYPGGEVFSHMIGFTNVDDHGQEGLELSYDDALSGKSGEKRVLRDGRRQVVADVESIRVPESGDNLALSLDQRLQYIAYRELKSAISEHDAVSGSVVLLDVKTGEVLAMVNQPGYNPNGNRDNRNGRLRNRAITDVFEPGSTMKPFTVAIGMELGLYDQQSTIDTNPGYFHVGRAKVQDHKNLGIIDLETLIRKSSNVGAARVALSIPKEQYWRYMSELGFGSQVGTGYPGESGGRLAPYDEWARIDQATLSFGYGISMTTLQLAQAYSVLAADGIKLPLSILRRQRTPEGKRVFSAATAHKVRQMMETVVAPGGTAVKAAIPGYRVAGKTGTAKKAGPGGYTQRKYLALFSGIAPATDPRLVCVVMINEPRGKYYYGGLVAAPVFSSVMEDALRLLNVAPDGLSEATGSQSENREQGGGSSFRVGFFQYLRRNIWPEWTFRSSPSNLGQAPRLARVEAGK